MEESLREMVERVDWMAPVHYSILEFFEDYDIIINPSSLAANIDYDTGQYVSEACADLEKSGLLQQHSTGPKYQLTDTGRAFLRGEIDPGSLPRPDDS